MHDLKADIVATLHILDIARPRHMVVTATNWAVYRTGTGMISEEEVRAALRRSMPRTAPDADGICIELYRKFRAQFVPMLARLVSAIGAAGGGAGLLSWVPGQHHLCAAQGWRQH